MYFVKHIVGHIVYIYVIGGRLENRLSCCVSKNGSTMAWRLVRPRRRRRVGMKAVPEAEVDLCEAGAFCNGAGKVYRKVYLRIYLRIYLKVY